MITLDPAKKLKVEEVNNRESRQEAYTKDLSLEGTFEKTVGDCLDAIIKAVYGDTSELDELVGKIKAIKTRFPKQDITITK